MAWSILLYCIVGLPQATSAPAQSRPTALTPEAVSSEMEQIRRGAVRGPDGREMFVKGGSLNITDDMLRAEDPQKALDLFEPYVKDPSSTIRMRACTLLRRTAVLHSTPAVRQRVVATLLDAYVRNPGEVDLELSVFQREADFSPAAKEIIRRLMAGDVRRPINLCGVAQLRDQLPCLGELLIDEAQYGPSWWATQGWRARLARARMGLQEDVQHCIALVESEPNETLRVGHLLAHIAYIRQPEAIRYLQKYLDSDKRFPDQHGGIEGDTRGQPYAYVALRLLWQCLDGFPAGRRIGAESRQEFLQTWPDVEQARRWMHQQTEWHIIR
jgi:hypothetical protein